MLEQRAFQLPEDKVWRLGLNVMMTNAYRADWPPRQDYNSEVSGVAGGGAHLLESADVPAVPGFK